MSFLRETDAHEETEVLVKSAAKIRALTPALSQGERERKGLLFSVLD